MVVSTDEMRLALSAQTEGSRKALLGQFLTPSSVARFMASLFDSSASPECLLLDPGAGIGTLSAAFLDRCVSGELSFRRISIDAFEIDDRLQPHLLRTLESFRPHVYCDATVRGTDFIETAVSALTDDLFTRPLPRYTHAILNPPYKKMRSDSAHRSALRLVGIETVNLYSAFVALSLALLEDQGQLVAIIPRSFCNGPYYRPFRDFILAHAAITHMHLFHARDKAFRDDKVLQENIIIKLERGVRQQSVTLSVSTGPIVDFRMRQHLLQMPSSNAAPLLYPGHFSGESFEWPKKDFRKPNAITMNEDTTRWLYPKGFYTVVRRFSSKEEKRRIVASVVNPAAFPAAEWLGFENHLNVFHVQKHGLPEDMAYGLAAFLNTRALDDYFRSFNGHTQVNATDLRQLRYPSNLLLTRLGKWARRHPLAEPEQIDEKVKAITA